MNNFGFYDLTRRQRLIGNILFFVSAISLTGFLILCASRVIDLELRHMMLPSLLIAIAVFWIVTGLVQAFNTVLIWCGVLSLYIAVIVLMHIYGGLHGASFVACLLSAGVVASIFTLPFSYNKLFHIRAIGLMAMLVLVYLAVYLIARYIDNMI